jgi:hypothetical protein
MIKPSRILYQWSSKIFGLKSFISRVAEASLSAEQMFEPRYKDYRLRDQQRNCRASIQQDGT